jgi:hypothetical protein
MADPNMTAEQKEQAMMKLPFHAENEAFQYLRADLTKKRAAKERINYQLQLKGQLYQQNQDLQQQTYADQGFSQEEIGQANRYDAGIAARPTTSQSAKKYIRATRGNKEVMLVIDPNTQKEIGVIQVGDIDGKSVTDRLKIWQTIQKNAGGQYLGIEGQAPLDPEMHEFATQKVNDIMKEMEGEDKPEFEQRMNQQDAPFIQNEDGTRSTHKMMSFEADGKFYAAPTVVMIDGKLTELSPDEAIKHAFKTGEVKEFATEAEAQAYGEGSWKEQAQPIQQEQQTKGQIYNKINEFMDIRKDYKANPDDFDRLITAVQAGQLTMDEAVELIRQSRGDEATSVKPYEGPRNTLTRQVQ